MARALQRIPAFQLMLKDQQFRAIGHVIVQWAFLESEINRELAWLRKRSEHKKKRVNFQARFSNRANRWLELANRSYRKHPSFVKAVERIGRQAINIKRERDELAHGNFASSGTFFKLREGKTIDVSDTMGAQPYLEDLACRISDINAALFRHQIALQKRFRKLP